MREGVGEKCLQNVIMLYFRLKALECFKITISFKKKKIVGDIIDLVINNLLRNAFEFRSTNFYKDEEELTWPTYRYLNLGQNH